MLELLVVLGVLGVLAILHVGANPHAKSKSETAVCLDNLRQLQMAWLMYARENRDFLPGNLDGGDAQSPSNTNRGWCLGWLENSSSRPDNTNVALLLKAQVGKYVPGSSVYKCPSDHSLSAGLKGEPRVRSVSLNGYMGDRLGPYTAGYRLFKKMNDVTDPTPSKAFVFIDEREDSINDPCLLFDMSGYAPRRPQGYTIVDYPADWHDGGVNLSFVDGHVEHWRWKDARTTPPHHPGRLIPLAVASPNNPDVARIQEAMSRPVSSVP